MVEDLTNRTISDATSKDQMEMLIRPTYIEKNIHVFKIIKKSMNNSEFILLAFFSYTETGT